MLSSVSTNLDQHLWIALKGTELNSCIAENQSTLIPDSGSTLSLGELGDGGDGRLRGALVCAALVTPGMCGQGLHPSPAASLPVGSAGSGLGRREQRCGTL